MVFLFLKGGYMKKLAIMGSGKGNIFEAIVKELKGFDVEITCISDVLEAEILKFAKDLKIKHQYLPYEENVEFFAPRNFDMVILTDYDKEIQTSVLELSKFINIHPSLLPSFKGRDAIYRTFDAGVKVTGVTVYRMANDINDEKILAQYPILIGNTTHFDELKEQVEKLEEILYPKVVKTLVEDKVFDFNDLFSHEGCGGSCGSCGGCH